MEEAASNHEQVDTTVGHHLTPMLRALQISSEDGRCHITRDKTLEALPSTGGSCYSTATNIARDNTVREDKTHISRSKQTAAERVFGTQELLDMILCNVPFYALLLDVRPASRAFRNAVDSRGLDRATFRTVDASEPPSILQLDRIALDIRSSDEGPLKKKGPIICTITLLSGFKMPCSTSPIRRSLLFLPPEKKVWLSRNNENHFGLYNGCAQEHTCSNASGVTYGDILDKIEEKGFWEVQERKCPTGQKDPRVERDSRSFEVQYPWPQPTFGCEGERLVIEAMQKRCRKRSARALL